MARVFTAKAAKDYPQHGIKKGETYYYWTPGFRGVKQMSKTPPKASQLTTSKMSEAYAAGEDLEEAIKAAESVEDLTTALEEAIDRIRAVAEEYNEAANATTGNGNRVPNADEMEEKASSLNDWADSIESDKSEVESLNASDYADMDIDIETLSEDLIEELDEDCEDCDGEGHLQEDACKECDGTGTVSKEIAESEECPACEGSGFDKTECATCDGTGQITKRVRKDVSDFDDLTDEEKAEMLEAARSIAEQNAGCPV